MKQALPSAIKTYTMLTFLERLKIEENFLSFYFNFCTTTSGSYYLVSVVDTDRKTQIFQMNTDTGIWVLGNPETCPPWIIKIEKQLADLISQHLSSQTS